MKQNTVAEAEPPQPGYIIGAQGGGDTWFRPPFHPAFFAPPSLGSTDHSFGNNLTTYKELYLLHTKI